MKENEWINIEHSMPGLHSIVEIKMKDGEKYKAQIQTDNTHFGIVFARLGDGCYFVCRKISHWRPISENQHDFSKLKKWDLLVIERTPEFGVERISCGYFFKIGADRDSKYIDLHQFKFVDHFGGFVSFNEIKKITRINLEEKTFEDI